MIQSISDFFEHISYFLTRHPYLAMLIVYMIILLWINFVIKDIAWAVGWPLTIGMLLIVPAILGCLAIKRYRKIKRQSNVLSLKNGKRIVP